MAIRGRPSAGGNVVEYREHAPGGVRPPDARGDVQLCGAQTLRSRSSVVLTPHQRPPGDVDDGHHGVTRGSSGQVGPGVLEGRRRQEGARFRGERRYDRDGQAAGTHPPVGRRSGRQGDLRSAYGVLAARPKSIELGRQTLGICPTFRITRQALAERTNLLRLAAAHQRSAWPRRMGAVFGTADGKAGALFQATEEPFPPPANRPTRVTRAAGARLRRPAATPEKFHGWANVPDRAPTAHLQRGDQIREYGMLTSATGSARASPTPHCPSKRPTRWA